MSTNHKSTLGASSSSRATVGRVTVMTPDSMELTMVTHTTVTKTIAVVPLPGPSRCSAAKDSWATLIGRKSSAIDGVSLLPTLPNGLAVRAGIDVSGQLTSSIDVAVCDMLKKRDDESFEKRWWKMSRDLHYISFEQANTRRQTLLYKADRCREDDSDCDIILLDVESDCSSWLRLASL